MYALAVCVCVQEAGFGLYSVYFKNMPQQEELLEDCAQYFRVSHVMRCILPSIALVHGPGLVDFNLSGWPLNPHEVK